MENENENENEKEKEMKLCERCGTQQVMPEALKDRPSTGEVLKGSPSGSMTYFYPTEPGRICFYCEKKKRDMEVENGSREGVGRESGGRVRGRVRGKKER